MSEIKKIIQKNIAFYRKSAKLTQKELADRIHVPATSLATWEQGKSLPDIDTLFLLCSALNVDILTISGFQPPENQHHYGDGIESAMKDFNNALHAMQAHSAKIGSTLTSQFSPDEQQLIDDYRDFNDEGKEKVRDYVADLSDNPKYKKCSQSSLAQEA